MESHHADVLPACVTHTKQSTLNVLGADEFVATLTHNEEGSRQTQRYLLWDPTSSFYAINASTIIALTATRFDNSGTWLALDLRDPCYG
jgi:hypothetical protein